MSFHPPINSVKSINATKAAHVDAIIEHLQAARFAVGLGDIVGAHHALDVIGATVANLVELHEADVKVSDATIAVLAGKLAAAVRRVPDGGA